MGNPNGVVTGGGAVGGDSEDRKWLGKGVSYKAESGWLRYERVWLGRVFGKRKSAK